MRRGQSAIALVLTVVMGVVMLPGGRQAAGADIGFANIIPGAGVAKKQVVSLREGRFLNLIEQKTDFSCGAAALATIIRYAYSRPETTEESVLQALFQVSDPEEVRRRGFSLLDLKNYLEAVGMRGRGYRISSENLQEIKVPCIALLDIKGYKHFVVFKKATAEKVYLGDPALGNKIMSIQDFVLAWNGVLFAVIGNGFDVDTALLRPTEPLTAGNLRAAYAPITEVDLLDFGFTHAELF